MSAKRAFHRLIIPSFLTRVPVNEGMSYIDTPIVPSLLTQYISLDISGFRPGWKVHRRWPILLSTPNRGNLTDPLTLATPVFMALATRSETMMNAWVCS